MPNKTEQSSDLTGQSKIIRNVLASWGGQLIYIISGFVMPRLIHNELGTEALGVWDFAWSIISYFGLMQGGIGASVNRYVAKYRTENDQQAINETVSSVMSVQVIAGVLVLLASATAAYFSPILFEENLGKLSHDAQWIIFLVGAGLAVQMSCDGFVGVITGYHRWDIHNGINAGIYALTATAMASVLLLGGGLIELALANLTGSIVTETIRVITGLRIAPSLNIHIKNVKFSVIKKQFAFGAKMLLPSISRLLMLQTTNVLIVVYLGPAMLAIFARPMALIRHVNTLLGKFAFVLTPIASSIQSQQDDEKLKKLFLQTTQAAFYMALPMIFGLAILGEELLYIWMGPEYAHGEIIAILAIGHLATIVHTPVFSFLMGLDAHGRPGVAKLIASIVVVILVVISFEYLQLGLAGAALAIVIPLTIVDGLYMPWFACSKLRLSLISYYWQATKLPILYCLPYITCLITSKVYFSGQPSMILIAGGFSGGLVILGLYWVFVIPEHLKIKIRKKLFRSS